MVCKGAWSIICFVFVKTDVFWSDFIIKSAVVYHNRIRPLYENTPIQIYRKFHLQKTENF